jgi:hypothetical protein
MAIVRGIAVVLDDGPDQCGAYEIAIEQDESMLGARIVAVCEQPPALLWLGKVGLCEGHALRMWPELAQS